MSLILKSSKISNDLITIEENLIDSYESIVEIANSNFDDSAIPAMISYISRNINKVVHFPSYCNLIRLKLNKILNIRNADNYLIILYELKARSNSVFNLPLMSCLRWKKFESYNYTVDSGSSSAVIIHNGNIVKTVEGYFVHVSTYGNHIALLDVKDNAFLFYNMEKVVIVPYCRNVECLNDFFCLLKTNYTVEFKSSKRDVTLPGEFSLMTKINDEIAITSKFSNKISTFSSVPSFSAVVDFDKNVLDPNNSNNVSNSIKIRSKRRIEEYSEFEEIIEEEIDSVVNSLSTLNVNTRKKSRFV